MEQLIHARPFYVRDEPESKTDIVSACMEGRQGIDTYCRCRQQPCCEGLRGFVVFVLFFLAGVLTGHRSQLSKVGNGIQGFAHILGKFSMLNLGLFLHI